MVIMGPKVVWQMISMSVIIRLHSHRKDKTKFIEWYLFQWHTHMFSVLRYFQLKFCTPAVMLVSK